MDFLKKLTNKRKIKYGAVLAIFLVLVISAVIIFNSIISVLAERFNWFFDMTEEQLYTASDDFVSAMDKINQNAQLEIVFFDEKDSISADHSSVGGKVGLAYVHQTATDLARKLDNISVSYHSIDDIDYINQFRDGGKISSERNVIIKRTDLSGDAPQFEVYNPSYFYAFDEAGALFAYNGEVRLLEASIRLSTNTDPTVYFTASHGETWYTALNGAVSQTSLGALFANAGFIVLPIDLDEKIYTCKNVINKAGDICGKQYSPTYDFGILEDTEREEITINGVKELLVKRDFVCSCGAEAVTITDSMLSERERLPANAQAIVINEPLVDFEEKEIELLESFLSNYGAVMSFLNSEADLPELYGWFETWGGIKVNNGAGILTADNSTTIEGNIPSDSAAAQAYFSDLISLDIDPKLTDAITLTIDEKFIEGNLESGYNVQRTATELLRAPSNAYANGSLVSSKDRTLMAITKSESLLANPDHDSIGEDEFTSYLMVSSSGFTDMLTDVTSANVNTKVIRSLIHATTGVQTYSTNLEFKVFNSYSLDITPRESTTFFIISLTVLPIIIGVTGLIIIIRRKRR